MILELVLILKVFKGTAIFIAYILIQSHTELSLMLTSVFLNIKSKITYQQRRIKVLKLMGAVSIYITGVFDVKLLSFRNLTLLL